MNVTLRPAEKQDSEAILRLIQELAVFEKEPESVLLTVSDIERYGFGNSITNDFLPGKGRPIT
jgi:hypothetical protein